MPVIDIRIEPHGVTRVFFDGRNASPPLADQQRIGQAVELSIALAHATDPEHDAPERLASALL